MSDSPLHLPERDHENRLAALTFAGRVLTGRNENIRAGEAQSHANWAYEWLSRREDAPSKPEPEPVTDPPTGAELYRPHRIIPSEYVVTDHPETSSDLLSRAASIMNELARRGAFAGDEFNTDPALPEVTRWFADYEGLTRS